jgi:hypothetical protein
LQLSLRSASPSGGLVGTLKSVDAEITFDVRRVSPDDEVARRDPDYAKRAQARIRDRRGITIWGIGSGLAAPNPEEETRASRVTSPTEQSDIELVTQLPNVIRTSVNDPGTIQLELDALEAAAAAFRGQGGGGGPQPVTPKVPENARIP